MYIIIISGQRSPKDPQRTAAAAAAAATHQQQQDADIAAFVLLSFRSETLIETILAQPQSSNAGLSISIRI